MENQNFNLSIHTSIDRNNTLLITVLGYSEGGKGGLSTYAVVNGAPRMVYSTGRVVGKRERDLALHALLRALS